MKPLTERKKTTDQGRGKKRSRKEEASLIRSHCIPSILAMTRPPLRGKKS